MTRANVCKTALITVAWGLAPDHACPQADGVEHGLPSYNRLPPSLPIDGTVEVVDDAREGWIPYSDDAASIDDRLDVQVATFSRSLGEHLQLSTEQQARLVELWREERTRLAHRLNPAATAMDLRRALDKGIALDDRSLEFMQRSLDRLLARLTEILSTEQLHRFADMERQKLEAQRRFLRMKQAAR